MNTDMMLVRALNTRRLAQIVLCFLAVRRPMMVDEICLWTDLSPEYANLGLNELKSLGVIGMQTLPHNKKLWLPGATMLLPFGVQLSGKAITENVGDGVMVEGEQLQLSGKAITGNVKDGVLVEIQPNSTGISVENVQMSQKVITGFLEEEEDKLSIKIKEKVSSTSESTLQLPQKAITEIERDPSLPSIRRIIDASPVLFAGFKEKRVVGLANLPLDAIEQEELLAIMAQAYAQRRTAENTHGVQSPVRLIYRMIKNLERADREYRLTPLEFLPDDYLEELGLMEYHCAVCEETFTDKKLFKAHEKSLIECKYGCGKQSHSLAQLEEHYQEHADEEAGAPVTCAPLPDSDRGSKAWQLVKDQLQMEMPRASYDTWVRDACAIEFDEFTLTVGARSSYTRDWLDSRVGSTINAMLSKIFTKPVTVKFVVHQVV